MRFRTFAVAWGLFALAATPCLALTFQAAPPSPDVAPHLRPTTATGSGLLPAPDELKTSFAASGRSQLGQGFPGATGPGTTSFNFGPLRGSTTVTPGYGGVWNGAGVRDRGNPLSIVPPRP